MNHFLLHLLFLSLKENLVGHRITGVGWLDPILSIASSAPGKGFFIALLADPGPFCYTATNDPTAACRPRRVFEELTGAKLRDVSLPEVDRTLHLRLSGRSGDLMLYLSLYGGSGGAVLARGNHIVASLGRTADRFPFRTTESSGKLRSFKSINERELTAHLATGSPPTEPIAGLDPDLIRAFTTDSGTIDIPGLLRFRDDLLRGNTPFFVAVHDRPAATCPLPEPPVQPGGGHMILGPFPNGGVACTSIGDSLTQKALELVVQRHMKPLLKHLASRKKLQARLRKELEEAKGHQQLRKETEALAAYQTRVQTGKSSVELPDPYEPERMLIIKLDPASSIQEQIAKRFRKASKLQRSSRRISRRLSEVEEESVMLEKELETIKTIRSFPDALRYIEGVVLANRLLKHTDGSTAKKPKEKTYRRYDIDPLWFVLVGRNNRENDEITFHIAGPNDWWFHAQNIPGSHVILKSKGPVKDPPRRVLLAAAEIAAFHSKSRHASLVPVIYTRRKYVRKPKKASPGKVLCERVKTIFAEPLIPDSPDPAGDI